MRNGSSAYSCGWWAWAGGEAVVHVDPELVWQYVLGAPTLRYRGRQYLVEREPIYHDRLGWQLVQARQESSGGREGVLTLPRPGRVGGLAHKGNLDLGRAHAPDLQGVLGRLEDEGERRVHYP